MVSKIIQGNTLTELKKLPAESVNCIITSPPYFALRDYGEETMTIWDGNKDCEHQWEIIKKKDPMDRQGYSTHDAPRSKEGVKHGKKWEMKGFKSGFCQKCNAWYGQLGLEPSLELYLKHLLEITAELKRVLRKDGVMFWNHGDCYSAQRWTGAGKGQPMNKFKDGFRDINPEKNTGLDDKTLVLQNYRLILKMVYEQKWYLRNQIIWHKPNHMPSSVKDRFANSYEPVYMLVKNKRYNFDLDAVRVPYQYPEDWEYRKDLWGKRGLETNYQFNKEKRFNIRDRVEKGGKPVGFMASPQETQKTKIPQDQAESFGSPRARNYRKGRGSNNPALDNRNFMPIKSLEERMKDTKSPKGSLAYNMKKTLSEIRTGAKPDFKKQDNVPGRNAPTYKGFNERWKNRNWREEEKEGYKMGSTDPHRAANIGGLKAYSKMRGDAQKILKERGCQPTGIGPTGADHNLLNNPRGKNPGDVWKIPTQPFPDAHFAVFPERLIEPMILAGCPKEVCKKCGKARERINKIDYQEAGKGNANLKRKGGIDTIGSARPYETRKLRSSKTLGWTDCKCGAGFEPGVILDPFGGAMTTAVVAKKLNRNYIMIEIKPEYCEMGKRRIRNQPQPLF